MALLAVLVLAGSTPVELPTTEDPADWEAALAMGGLVVGPVAGEAWVRLEPAADLWLLRVQDRGGALHEVRVAPPATEQEREDIVWLAVSLLHPSGVDGPEATPAPRARVPEREPVVEREPAAPTPTPEPVVVVSAPEPTPAPEPLVVVSEPELERPAAPIEPAVVVSEPETAAPEVVADVSAPGAPAEVAEEPVDAAEEPARSLAQPDDEVPEAAAPDFEPEASPEPEGDDVLFVVPAPEVAAGAEVAARQAPWAAARPRWFTTVGLGTDGVIGGTPGASLHLDLGFDVRGFFRLGVSGAVTSPSALLWPDGAAVMYGGDFFPLMAWLSPTQVKRRLWIGAGLGMRVFTYAEPSGSSGTLASQIEDLVDEALDGAGLEGSSVSWEQGGDPGQDVSFAVRLEVQGAVRLSEWAALAPWFQLQVVALDEDFPASGRPHVLFPLTFRGGISFVMMRHVGRGLPAVPRR